MNRAIFVVAILFLFCSCSSVPEEEAVTSQPEGCTRAVLQAAVDSYLAAQGAGDPSMMALASEVQYIENWEEVSKEDGLWNTALPITFSRSFLDVDACRTFTEVIVTDSEPAYVFGTRLKVDNGEISEINSLVTKEGDWLFNADDYLKYSTAEDWRVLNPEERVSREELMAGGDAYFDHFADRTVEIPFGAPCARLEGGIYTSRDFDSPDNTCNLGFPVDKLPMRDRSYVVDEEMGTVNIFLLFGNPPGAPDSHTFRLVNGKIRYIHTLTLTVPGVDVNAIMGGQPKSKPKAPVNTE
jgi:hypothetical protein